MRVTEEISDRSNSQVLTAACTAQDDISHMETGHETSSSPCRLGSANNGTVDTDRIAQHFTNVIGHDQKLSEDILKLIPSPGLSMPIPTIKFTPNAVENAETSAESSSRFTCINETQSDVYECVIRKQNGCIGLTLACVDDHVQITAVMDGTPASRCGLRVGDIVVAVSGLPVSELQFSNIIGYLKSNARKSVVLKLRRNPFQSNSPTPNAKRLRNGSVKEIKLQSIIDGEMEQAESEKGMEEDQFDCQNEKRYVKLCGKVFKTLRRIRVQRELMEKCQIEDATSKQRQTSILTTLIRDSRHAVWEQERLILDIVTRLRNQTQNVALFGIGNRICEETFYGVRQCVLDLLFESKYRKGVSEDRMSRFAAIHADMGRVNNGNEVTTQSEVFKVELDACAVILQHDLSDSNLIPNDKEEMNECKVSISDDGLVCIYHRLDEVLHLLWEFRSTKSQCVMETLQGVTKSTCSRNAT